MQASGRGVSTRRASVIGRRGAAKPIGLRTRVPLSQISPQVGNNSDRFFSHVAEVLANKG
jgi:hypothetical protein